LPIPTLLLTVRISFDDLEEQLIPHLLVGRRLLSHTDDFCFMVDKDDKEFSVRDDTLKKRTKYLNSVVNHFWNRWVKDYLQDLCNAHHYTSKQ